MSSTDAPTDDAVVVEDAAPQEASRADELRDGMLARFTEKLGDGIVETHVQPGVDIWIRVSRDGWGAAAQVAKDLGFTYFCYVSAVDWMPSPYGKSEDDSAPTSWDGTIESGVAGGDTRFQLIARLESPVQHVGITFKCDVPDDDLTAPTWSKVFPGADWHESECWEMFGITFRGHPGHRHMYLPGDFEGHPLRKDFPLISRMVKPWPGLVDVEPMPGEPEGDEDAEAGTEGGDE